MTRSFLLRTLLVTIIAVSCLAPTFLRAEPWSVPDPSKMVAIQPVSPEKLAHSVRPAGKDGNIVRFSPAPHVSTYRLGLLVNPEASPGENYFPAQINQYVLFVIYYDFTLNCEQGTIITFSDILEKIPPTHGLIATNGNNTVPVTAGPEAGACAGNVYKGTPVYYEWTDTSHASYQDAFQLIILGTAIDNYTASIDATEPDKDLGKTCPRCADPISVANGNVYEEVTDYQTADGRLAFTRSYNSLSSPSTYAKTLGWRWRSNYDRYLHILLSNDILTGALIERPDGQIQSFTYNGSTFTSDSDISATLVLNSAGEYVYTDPDDTVETYNVISYFQGQLTQIVARGGYTTNLAYNSDNTLASVTDMYGRSLTFGYTSGMLTSLVTAEGTDITYGYATYASATSSGNALATVAYPTTPATGLTYQHSYVSDTSWITAVIDEDGNTYASWTYDQNGRGLSSQLAGGANLTTVSYDDSGSGSGMVARTVTNALGVADTYSFTLLQNVPKVSSISRASTATTAAATRSFTYDANGYLASSTDWNGYLTSFVNDARGDPTSEVEASGTSVARTTTTVWDAVWHQPDSVATQNLTTTYVYGTLGNVASRRDVASGLSRTWSYVWTNGNLTKVTGPRTDVSQVTRFTYDSTGGLASVIDAVGNVTRYTNTPGGLPTVQTDPNGVVSRFTYDGRQRLLTRALSTAAGTLTTSFAYDPAGNAIKTTLPDGSYLAYGYDAAHRLTMLADPLGSVIGYTLDALGDRTATAIGKSGGAATWQDSATFDALGRKIVDVQGAGQTTSYTYDPQSQLLTTTDPLSRVTTQVPDALGRISSITDPANGVTSFTYDQHDRLLKETAPNKAATTNTYDGFGRLTQRISPDSGTTTYTYDLANNLTASQDAAGVVTDHTYDALDRITSTTYPADAAENVTDTYDQTGHGFGIGRLTSLTDAAGSASFTYDERGNQLTQKRVSGAVTLTTTTAYDKASRVASVTYPSGVLASYTHDQAGHVTAIAGQAGSTQATIVSGATYAPFGPLTAMSYGDGVAETRTYDLSYRMSQLTTGTVQGLTYSYNAADLVTGIADSVTPGNAQTFGYDTLNRLKTAAGAYGSFAWTYDASGNRLTQTLGGVSTTYGYTAKSNLLSSLASGGSTTQVTTSAAGNTLAVTPASGSAVIRTYNQAERLANVTIGGTQTAAYTYDAFGNRFAKTTAAGTSLFQYDPAGHLLEETTGAGGLKTDTFYLNGAPVADVTPAALFFLHTDRLGTPQVSTTTSGAVAWRAAYQPFGTNTGTSGLFTQNLRFPGQYADAETGDYQNGFRDYDPSLGRYLETDPIGLAGGVNSFAYAAGNPIGVTDRSGLCPPCIVLAVEAAELAVESVEAAEVAGETVEEAEAAEPAADALRRAAELARDLAERIAQDSSSHCDLTDARGAKHILDGDGPGRGGGHRAGTGKSGKSEFPSSWSDKKILDAVSDVATDPASTRTSQGSRNISQGTVDGVDIQTVDDGRRIITGYPTNAPRNP